MKDVHADLPDPLATLPALLRFQVGRRATGTLIVHGESAERRMVLVNGEVRAARSSAEEEKIGNWLVGGDHISENDRAQALFSQGQPDSPPLGFILVNRGILSRETLERELQELALEIIRRATRDFEAQLEFVEEKSSDELDTLAELTTTQILLTTARAYDRLTYIREQLGDPTQIVSPANDLVSLIQDLALTPTEAFLLSRIEGSRSLSSLLQVSSLPEEQATSTVFSLVTAGLLKIGPALLPAPTKKAADNGSGNESTPVNEDILSDHQLGERREVRRLAQSASSANHYEALGLVPGAPPVEILEAWKTIQDRYGSKRAGEYHLSDSGRLLEAVRGRAQDAYQVLGKAESRHRYDEILAQISKDKARMGAVSSPAEIDQKARNIMVKANVQRANELIREGEIHLAIQLLEQACAFEPRPVELVKLARLLVRNPMWDNRALNHLRKAIQVDPKFVDAWIETAEYWRRHRDTERQRKALERALAIDPDGERANRMYRQLEGDSRLKRVLRLSRLTKR